MIILTHCVLNAIQFDSSYTLSMMLGSQKESFLQEFLAQPISGAFSNLDFLIIHLFHLDKYPCMKT